MRLDHVHEVIAEISLTTRGAFHPVASDGVPNFHDDRVARTVVLVGNAGEAMWQQFTRDCDPDVATLDSWSVRVLDRAADELGGRALYPFTQPYLPFQQWARKAEPCHVSPLGILIHPEYGLWHGYRGALVLAEKLVLPARIEQSSPCDSCAERPCLTTCPVGAFDAEADYDVPSCIEHIRSPAGEDCLQSGCLARRACPIGRDYIYTPAQAEFHMAAFLKNHPADQHN